MEKGPVLIFERMDRIVVITLNRPEKMNAMNQELTEKLNEAFRQFDSDGDAWVAIITAAGDKAFSVGGDLNDPNRINAAKLGKLPDWYYMDIYKPMIAAINGYCLTLGWALASKCDIRIAADHSQFGITETKFNLGGQFTGELVRQLHQAHALEIALWGDQFISAQRIYEMGWVNKLVSKEKLMDEAMLWAERMLYLGPKSVRDIKKMIYHAYHMAPSEYRAFAAAVVANRHSMEDTVEGIKAYKEKRKPIFRNR